MNQETDLPETFRFQDFPVATTEDERFMLVALKQAAEAGRKGEVPIGACVVYQGEVIAQAHNRRELDCSPSAHAEFLALSQAAEKLGRWRLSGCTVYVTLEPCSMCAGLMVNSRVDRCVYGAKDPKGGALGSLYDLSEDSRLNHQFAVTSGVLEDACAQMLKSFFKWRRAHQKQQKKAGQQGQGCPACQCQQGLDAGAFSEADGKSQAKIQQAAQERLSWLRSQINQVDRVIHLQLERRLELSQEIAETKQVLGRPVFDPVREESLLEQTRLQWAQSHPDIHLALQHQLMEISKDHQRQWIIGAAQGGDIPGSDDTAEHNYSQEA